MPNYLPLVRPLVMALSLANVSAVIAAPKDTGNAVLAAQAACDGSVFAALAADAARWKRERSFKRVGKLATFKVADRKPPEYGGRNSDAALEFARSPKIGTLQIGGWFDADLSAWSRFANAGVGFLSWGFYVNASSAELREALMRAAPAIARQMQPSTSGKEGVYCVEESLQDGQWVGKDCTADEDFPTSQTPHRWLVIRPDGPGSDRTVLSCELAGKLEPALLKKLRPDL